MNKQPSFSDWQQLCSQTEQTSLARVFFRVRITSPHRMNLSKHPNQNDLSCRSYNLLNIVGAMSLGKILIPNMGKQARLIELRPIRMHWLPLIQPSDQRKTEGNSRKKMRHRKRLKRGKSSFLNFCWLCFVCISKWQNSKSVMMIPFISGSFLSLQNHVPCSF